jgi:hypothetical protein
VHVYKRRSHFPEDGGLSDGRIVLLTSSPGKASFCSSCFLEKRMDLKMKTIGKALALAMMFGIFAAPVTMATASVEEQPHMRAALEHLKLAKAELEQAEADKGGHRVAALKATNDAIHHAEEGIQYANHH